MRGVRNPASHGLGTRWTAGLGLMLAASFCQLRLVAEPLALVDRIVAVVDDDPILLSDVERVIALGLTERRPDENDRQLHRRVLDGLIDHRLRLHEVDHFESAPVEPEAIEARLEELRKGFADPASWRRALAHAGLEEADLRHLLAQRIRVLRYVEERLGARVLVDQEDIEAYYASGVFARDLARHGLERPPLEEVREPILQLLRQRRLNREIEIWTRDLRLAAEVVDRFERSWREPPPLIRRLVAPSP